MTDQIEFEAALAGLGLPAEWQVMVAVRPRRHTVGIEVLPGGTVAVLVPPTTAPEDVAQAVRGRRRWIAKNVDKAARLAPDHPVKDFIEVDAFDLLGQRYRLQLVDSTPVGADQWPTLTVDGVLYARRQLPEQVRRAVTELYRQVGLAWAKREGRQYELDGRIEGLSYVVHDLGRHRWGVYDGQPKHTTTIHWAVFGLPMRLIEYVLVHEQAHATLPPGRPHGPAWQRQMSRWMPGWERRKTELAEAGRHAWLGDYKPPGPVA